MVFGILYQYTVYYTVYTASSIIVFTETIWMMP